MIGGDQIPLYNVKQWYVKIKKIINKMYWTIRYKIDLQVITYKDTGE